MTELKLGDWRVALEDVEKVDSVIVDPPYGERTHVGHDAGVNASGNVSENAKREMSKEAWATARAWRKLTYSFWTVKEVTEFVEHWSPRTTGWLCAFSCSDLFPVWREAFEDVGRVAFAPIPCVIRAMSVRLAGDGPSNWAVYLNVARPKGKDDNWGTRVGAYVVNRENGGHIGGKPRRLMDAIVRDYSKPGDLVCDPCAGYATTAMAAEAAGRSFIGAEVDPDTHAAALERLSSGVQLGLSL